jgi:Domain of unknown function (DUF4124)
MLSNERRATINEKRIAAAQSIGFSWTALAMMAITLAFTVPSPLVAKTVYQCKGPDGRITLQDQACASGDKQSEQEILDAYRGTPQKAKRSAKAKREFQASNPCPRNDHIKPLCAGGADTPANMQWLTLEKHREKTRLDLFECRTLRKRG